MDTNSQSTTMKPKISVILPVYDGALYLREAIQSVLDQTFTLFEFIIIDDGSKDDSLSIIKSFTDPRIVVIQNETNKGFAETLNIGLRNAKTAYIARIDSDDIWNDVNKLKNQIEFLEKNPDHALVGTFAQVITDEGIPLYDLSYPCQDAEIRKNMLIKDCFIHSSVLYIKDLVLQSEGYRFDEPGVEDYGLWLRMGEKMKFANIPSYSVLYRINPKGMSEKSKINHTKNSLLVIKKSRHAYPHYYKALLKWQTKLFILSVFGSHFFDTVKVWAKR